MILIPALVITTLYGWQTQGRPTVSWTPPGTGSSLSLPITGATNPFGMSGMSPVNPGLVARGQQVTGKALDVADQALQATGTAVDTGGKVINFGAGLIQQALPPSTPGTSNPTPLTHPSPPSP